MRSTLLLLTALTLLASPLVAQGPPPAGIRAKVLRANPVPAKELDASRRRMTPVGRGALIGAFAGAAIGYLGTTETAQRGSDGIPRAPVMIGMAVFGGLIGALVGYIVSDKP